MMTTGRRTALGVLALGAALTAEAQFRTLTAHEKAGYAKGDDAAVLEARVRADFPGTKASLVWYDTPPMSDLQRLPDLYPEDAVPGGTLRVLLAKDEYEPAAFSLYAFRDLGKVEIELGEFRRDQGSGIGDQGGVVFPKENLDLRLVKVWYQNLNGWYSYFSDGGLKLCPELLLHDEDLIRVDTKRVANYARVRRADGTTYEHWLTSTPEMDERYWNWYEDTHTFSPMMPGFADAKTLQPVRLPKGEFRNFFLTVHATKETPAGLYRGEIKVKSKSEKGKSAEISIPVAIRVHDFVLPQPKGYYKEDLDYWNAAYEYVNLRKIRCMNGNDKELARRQLLAIFRNYAAHNQTIHCLYDNGSELELMKEAGLRTDVILTGAGIGGPERPACEIEADARRLAKFYDRQFGHHNVVITYGDEPGADWLMKNRPIFEAYAKYGMSFFIAGARSVFHKAAPFYGWHNLNMHPEEAEGTDLWRTFPNVHVAWYSMQHVGVENPCYNRRQYGLLPYLTGYTANCNYAHHLWPYNDRGGSYKPMMFIYGSYDGCIDTLSWEGFREGVDDIRYATALMQLSKRAMASETYAVREAGLRARQYLAQVDRLRYDPDEVRGELTLKVLDLLDKLGTNR